MKTEDLLRRRVEKVLPSREGLESLMSKRKIRLYQGFDPTGSRLHLGHTIGLRVLNDFAISGHEVIFLFGTGTVLVGDPSQRDEARGVITQEEIDRNIKNWKKQVSPLVDFKKVKIKQNGDWLTKLTLKDIVNVASNISAVQLFKRESFTKRIERGDTVWYHETMYPLLQGYDSVVMDVDLEVGGTDQEFNMLIGRELMRKMKSKEKYVLTTPMILGTDGNQMSKSSGNCVWLDDSASDMFGKLMSIPDSQIVPYLQFVTDIPMKEVVEIEKGLTGEKLNPKDVKSRLAKEVVTQFHGSSEARKQEREFEQVFRKGRKPSGAPVVKVKSGDVDLPEILREAGIVTSNSEAKRLISQGAIELDGTIVRKTSVSVEKNAMLKVGKHRFVELIIN